MDLSQPKGPHPTAVKLLDAAVELLDEVPIDAVSLAMVLDRCGVAQGSLYHHYEDLADLIEKAAVRRYSRGLLESLAALRALLECNDAAEFRRSAELLLVESNEQRRRPNRLERLDVLAASRTRPQLASAIGKAQRDVIEQQAVCLAELQRRGWIRPDVDPLVVSTLVAVVIFGRVVDDLSERPVDPALWSDVAVRAIFAVVYPA